MKLVLAILAIASSVADAKPLTRPEPIEIRIHEIVVTGSPVQGVVARTLHVHYAKFRSCFEKLLEPKAKPGSIAVAFEVTPTGTTRNPVATGLQGEVARCSKEVVERIEFERGKPGRVTFKIKVVPV